jgi:hypothetical protein
MTKVRKLYNTRVWVVLNIEGLSYYKDSQVPSFFRFIFYNFILSLSFSLLFLYILFYPYCPFLLPKAQEIVVLARGVILNIGYLTTNTQNSSLFDLQENLFLANIDSFEVKTSTSFLILLCFFVFLLPLSTLFRLFPSPLFIYLFFSFMFSHVRVPTRH